MKASFKESLKKFTLWWPRVVLDIFNPQTYLCWHREGFSFWEISSPTWRILTMLIAVTSFGVVVPWDIPYSVLVLISFLSYLLGWLIYLGEFGGIYDEYVLIGHIQIIAAVVFLMGVLRLLLL